jgi:protein-S-isoprenylcysteine O-methyltransferase Ste14
MNVDWSKKVVPFIVFFLVANPETFKLTRSLLGSWVGSTYGVPSNLGLLLHALVFVLLCAFVWQLVYGKRVSTYHRPDTHTIMRAGLTGDATGEIDG